LNIFRKDCNGTEAGSRARIPIAIVAWALPNFLKITHLVRALEAASDGFACRIAHDSLHGDGETNNVVFLETRHSRACFRSWRRHLQ
jgi:hypothetical protein